MQETINLTTINIFCKQNKIKKINFLKMDTEGHELEVLKGASNLLNKNLIDFIQFEFGGCNINSRTFFQDYFYLLRDKFHIYRILKRGLHKITHYQEIYEQFLTTNYLAQSKKI